MYLIPGQGKFVTGLDVFQFDPRLDTLTKELLDNYQIRLNSLDGTIPISFIPEAIPGIQLSNDYGASILLEGIQQLGGPLLGQIGQMMGVTEASKGIEDALSYVRKATEGGGAVAQGAGAVLGGIGESLRGAKEWAKKTAGDANAGVLKRTAAAALQTVDVMAMGARIDFPKVWMGSGFTGPVSIPVRLYNPDQTSDVSYNKYIIEPLAVLLNLGAPISSGENIYRWPYIHRIWSPGMFYWKMASLIGLTVQPGPENQMSWNNRPSMIDVRLDFQPLHSVMLGRRKSTSVPAIGDYIDQLKKKENAPHLWNVPTGAPNVANWTPKFPIDEISFESPGTPTPTTDPSVYRNPGPRVPEVDEFDYTALQNKQAASGSNPTEDRINEEAIAAANARSKADNLAQAAQTQQSQDAALQSADQKTLQDKERQDQLNVSDSEFGGLPISQASQIANTTAGSGQIDGRNQVENYTTTDSVAYTQSADGAPPNQDLTVTKEVPEGGKPPGQSDAFWSSVSSKLTAAGTAIVGAGKNISTSVIDGATYKANQVTNILHKAGITKDQGEGIKTTVTSPTTVEEVRREGVFPDVGTETSIQEIQVSKTTEIATENQSYIQEKGQIDDGIQRAGWAYRNGTITEAQYNTTVSQYNNSLQRLNTNHQIVLTSIENKYNP